MMIERASAGKPRQVLQTAVPFSKECVQWTSGHEAESLHPAIYSQLGLVNAGCAGILQIVHAAIGCGRLVETLETLE